MPLSLNKKKGLVKTDKVDLINAQSKEKKDHSKGVIAFILFVMATLLTLCSLYMVGMTAFERSATKGEAFIIAGVAVCVALSAHLLPALVKGRQSIHVYSMISLIWLTCVSATLYSHTLFFVTTQNEKADVRSENSPEIKNIQDLIAQKEKWISDQKTRSLNDINISIANETIKIEQLLPRDCDTCKTTKAKISSYKARRAAFEEEKKIAENIEKEKEKVLQMQEQIVNIREDKRTDAVFEKMSKIFPGISYEAFNLSSSITNALLLEILATLFWWLLFPSKDKKSDKLNVSMAKKPMLSGLFGKNKNNQTVQIQAVARDENVIHGELIDDDDPLLLETALTKIQNKNLSNFKRNLFDNSKTLNSYAMFENVIFEIVSEELFISRFTHSICKNEKPETEHVFYDPTERFKVEDIILSQYVVNIYKNIVREAPVQSALTLDVSRTIPSYGIKEPHFSESVKNIEPEVQHHDSIRNNFDQLNMEDLLDSQDGVSSSNIDGVLSHVDDDDHSELEIKSLSEIIKIAEPVKEEILDEEAMTVNHINKDERNDDINANSENEDNEKTFNSEDCEPLIFKPIEAPMSANIVFEFDLNKPLVGKYAYSTNEHKQNKASAYIDKFLGLDDPMFSKNKKQSSSVKTEDEGKKATKSTIMDEVFLKKYAIKTEGDENKATDEIVKVQRDDFIDDKQTNFINNIDSILDTLEIDQ